MSATTGPDAVAADRAFVEGMPLSLNPRKQTNVGCCNCGDCSIKRPGVVHDEMLDDWPDAQCRNEGECADDHDGAKQQHDKSRPGDGKASQALRNPLLGRQASCQCKD